VCGRAGHIVEDDLLHIDSARPKLLDPDVKNALLTGSGLSEELAS